ncbi:MAG: diacylglycerol kinase [Deinococcota bacterium]|nr:diacylglycerol kinase [Deinococcota bacterium]
MARLRERPKARPRAEPLDKLAPDSPLAAFRHAGAGLAWAWAQERNFRIEFAIGLAALALSLVLGVNPAPVLLAAVLVLGLELINSAVEATIDLVTPDFHPLAKIAKDLTAAAVMLAAMGALLVGLLVLGPPLWQALFGIIQ